MSFSTIRTIRLWQKGRRFFSSSPTIYSSNSSHPPHHIHTPHIPVDIDRAHLARLLDRGNLPSVVKIVEVGPRDGLQNEPGKNVTTDIKVELVDRLLWEGNLSFVEAGSMVSKKAVPAMADSDLVLQRVKRKPGTARLSVLTPNLAGFKLAMENGSEEVAVFAAATDAFSLRNINCNVLDSLARFAPVMEEARKLGIPVRGYVSCVVGCPFSGYVAPSAVAFVASALKQMGCYEISLGDTIGVGTPWSIRKMLHAVVHEAEIPTSMLALHAHDTYGSALANVMAALECGVSVVDSSVAGLGGCPYAGGGASGNVATEDVVYMLHGLGIETGVNLDAVADIGEFITGKLGIPTRSKVGAARSSRKRALKAALEAGKPRQEIELALSHWPQLPTLNPTAEFKEVARTLEQHQQERDYHMNNAAVFSQQQQQLSTPPPPSSSSSTPPLPPFPTQQTTTIPLE